MPGPNLGLDEQTQALLDQLTGSLETPKVAPLRQPSVGQTALGAVSDALHARAAIAAGGQAPAIGNFAATQQAERQRFDEQTQQVELAKTALHNQLKISAFGQKIKLMTARETAKIQQEMQQSAADQTVRRNLELDLARRHLISPDDDTSKMSLVELASKYPTPEEALADITMPKNIPPGLAVTGLKFKDGQYVPEFGRAPEDPNAMTLDRGIQMILGGADPDEVVNSIAGLPKETKTLLLGIADKKQYIDQARGYQDIFSNFLEPTFQEALAVLPQDDPRRLDIQADRENALAILAMPANEQGEQAAIALFEKEIAGMAARVKAGLMDPAQAESKAAALIRTIKMKYRGVNVTRESDFAGLAPPPKAPPKPFSLAGFLEDFGQKQEAAQDQFSADIEAKINELNAAGQKEQAFELYQRLQQYKKSGSFSAPAGF